MYGFKRQIDFPLEYWSIKKCQAQYTQLPEHSEESFQPDSTISKTAASLYCYHL
jgi:hypothetical protein